MIEFKKQPLKKKTSTGHMKIGSKVQMKSGIILTIKTLSGKSFKAEEAEWGFMKNDIHTLLDV